MAIKNNKKLKSIKKLCNDLSLTSILLAFIFSSIILLILFFKYSQNAKENEFNRLQEIHPLIARPLQANDIVGDSRAKVALLTDLLEKYHLSTILISDDSNFCHKLKSLRNYNFVKNWFTICISIPFNNSLHQFLILESKSLKYNFKVIIELFLLINLPILLLGWLNTWILRKKLDKYIVDPIKTLSDNPGKVLEVSAANASEIIYLQNKFSQFINNLNIQRNIIEDGKLKESIFKLAAQVAHDIRSPLAALSILTMDNDSNTEQSKVLIHNAIHRIKEITNDIIEKNRGLKKIPNTNNHTSVQLLIGIIPHIIAEKCLQYPKSKINIQFDLTPQNYGIFVRIKLIEFKRMLSNIIDNAIEALSENGAILITIYCNNKHIHLNISDNGRGIPSFILKKIGHHEVSYNKHLGSGLGLYHAKKTMEQLNGKLVIKSDLVKGTNVRLTFPSILTPKWFCSKLKIQTNTIVVILNDKSMSHQFWKKRFKLINPKVSVINFDQTIDFFNWKTSHNKKAYTFLYLFDFESDQTGIKIIKEFNLQEKVILIANNLEDSSLQEQCAQLDVKLIPQNLAWLVPITVD